MDLLIDLGKGAALRQGLFPSIGRNEEQLWRTGSNVEFGAISANKALGFTNEVVPPATVYAAEQAFVSGNKRAYYATLTEVHQWQNGADLRLGQGFTGFYWSLCPWGTWLIATNETEPMKVYKDTGIADSMVDLGGFTGVRAGRRYRLMKKHQNHVLGYYGQTVEWCAESDPETWVPAVANSAGGFFIRELDSDIIAATPLGQHFAIYSTDSMVLQEYIGAPFYFSFRQALKGIGAVSDAAVVSVGEINYGMSAKGFWQSDGVSFTYIDNPQISKFVKANYDPSHSRRVSAVFDEESDTIKWFFPTLALTRMGVAYNVKTGSWTILDQPITAAASKSVFSHPLIGTATSFGFLDGYDLGGDAMQVDLQTFPLAAGQRNRLKKWEVLRADFEGGGLEVRWGFLDELKDDGGTDIVPDWSDWTPLLFENWVDGGGRESVYVVLDFRSTAPGANWSLTGLTLHGVVTGFI